MGLLQFLFFVLLYKTLFFLAFVFILLYVGAFFVFSLTFLFLYVRIVSNATVANATKKKGEKNAIVNETDKRYIPLCAEL